MARMPPACAPCASSCSPCCWRSRRRAAAQQAYVFTYFTGNGEDGLHLAWSADGYRWEKLNDGRSYLTPTVGTSKLMRDPCVVRGPDGTFHMVWTTGWNEATIGYASSRDLMTWTGQKAIPVMAHEPTVLNSWAPEIVYDAARGEFVIFWASTIPGRFPQTAGSSEEKYNHRIYCTTTKDFVTFTPTALFYDPGFSVIDATFLDTGAGRRLIVKDETLTRRRNTCRSRRSRMSTGRSAGCRRRSRRRGVGGGADRDQDRRRLSGLLRRLQREALRRDALARPRDVGRREHAR